MKSFSDFVKLKAKDPKRSIIAEANSTIDDNRWDALISMLSGKQIISIVDTFMTDNIVMKPSDTGGLQFRGPAVWSLDRARVIEIDDSAEGIVRVKDIGGWWNVIRYK